MTDTQNPDAVRDVVAAAEKPQETTAQAVARLAVLPPLEYEKARKAEAEKLGIDRVSVLDDEVFRARKNKIEKQGSMSMFPIIEPYPDPVDGDALLDAIHETLKRFIVCDPATAIAGTLWIVFTWFIDQAQVAPLAIITAPEKRCGKSQMLALIGKLSRRPLVASNISAAAIFRIVEAHSPTLLIDEADTFLRENEEARGIINSGHTRSSAYVIRVVGDDHTPQQFKTWGAKVLCGIGTLPDTLMDRALILELRRKLAHEKVERLRHADPAHFDRLTSMLARYAQDAGSEIEQARPILPDVLNDRAQDNWEPLLAIADHAGGKWPELAYKAALAISGAEQDATSLSAELLADIREIFETKHMEKISTANLLQELCADDLKPWATYNKGKPLSSRQLAKRLGEYGIKSQNICIGPARPKGYYREQFEDVFARYLTSPSHDTSEKSAIALQNGSNARPEPFLSVADHAQHSGARNLSATRKTAENMDCSVVADKTQDIEDMEERLAIQQFDGGL